MSLVSNDWQEQECSCRREEQPHSLFFWESRWYLRLILHAERVRSLSTRSSWKNLLRVPGVTHWSVLFSTAWDSTQLCGAQIARVSFTAALAQYVDTSVHANAGCGPTDLFACIQAHFCLTGAGFCAEGGVDFPT